MIRHKFFEWFIILCILVNTIFLAMDYHGISAELDAALEFGNEVKFVFFIVLVVVYRPCCCLPPWEKDMM